MTLVNNITLSSGAQHYCLTSVCSIAYSLPEVWFPSITIYLMLFTHFLPHPHSLLVTTLLFVSVSFKDNYLEKIFCLAEFELKISISMVKVQ